MGHGKREINLKYKSNNHSVCMQKEIKAYLLSRTPHIYNVFFVCLSIKTPR